MVRVRFDKNTHESEIIDDSEGLPGFSRQVTRFREYCYPVFKKVTGELFAGKAKPDSDTLSKLDFNEYGFRKAGAIDKDSYMIFCWESNE